MERIRERDLELLVARINKLAGRPAAPYVHGIPPYKMVAQIGCYHLSGAYGGWALYEISNEAGGCHDVSGFGHQPKRELYNFLRGMLAGLEG